MKSCYGSALCYQPGTPTCDRCTVSSGCAAEVGRRLEGRQDSLHRVTVVPILSPVEDAGIVAGEAGASRKTRLELRRLAAAGVNLEKMRADLLLGVNPMGEKKTPRYLHEAFERMRKGTVDLRALRMDYETQGTAPATARSQIAVIKGLLHCINLGVFLRHSWRLK